MPAKRHGVPGEYCKGLPYVSNERAFPTRFIGNRTDSRAGVVLALALR
jgi:hypothetical protein